MILVGLALSGMIVPPPVAAAGRGNSRSVPGLPEPGAPFLSSLFLEKIGDFHYSCAAVSRCRVNDGTKPIGSKWLSFLGGCLLETGQLAARPAGEMGPANFWE